MPYTAQFFAEKLGVAVEYFNPFRNVTIEPGIDLEELAKVAHGFGEVVGLGLRNLARCPVELNLVPKSIRSKQGFEQKKPYFIATMASLILAVFAIGGFYGRSAEIKRAALADLKLKMAPLEKRAAEMDRLSAELKRTNDETEVFSGYLKNRYFWPEALVQMRNLLVKVEEKLARPGQDAGVWIENFGAVYEEEPEESEATTPAYPGFGNMDLETIRRYFPAMYEMLKQRGVLGQMTNSTPMLAAKPTLNTNLVTIHVKFKAVNLNQQNDPAANGRLAFTVAEEFRKDDLFDANGTKLTGEIEEPEMITPTFGTFKFGMTLKLKNEMQL